MELAQERADRSSELEERGQRLDEVTQELNASCADLQRERDKARKLGEEKELLLQAKAEQGQHC